MDMHTCRVLESLAISLDTIAPVKRIKRQINLLPGMLYLPLKCKSAAIRLAHSVAMGNKMYSRIKTFVGYSNSSEKSKMTYSEDKRKKKQ